MYQHQQNRFDLFAFKWFAAVTLVAMAWGLFAAWVAFKYKIPLDLFNMLANDLNLTQSLVIGLLYGLLAGFILVVLGALGYYNPIIAFTILLAGIIMFFDFVFGASQINEPKNLIWLMAVPFVVIRDVVTYRLIKTEDEKEQRKNQKQFDGTKSQESFF